MFDWELGACIIGAHSHFGLPSLPVLPYVTITSTMGIYGHVEKPSQPIRHSPAHSSAMTDTIPAGSYVIRHVGTGLALSYAGQDKLTTEIRDEGNPQYREDQTWWIEPLPKQHEFEKKTPTLYTITRLVEGKSLDAPESKSVGVLCTYRSHGAPWQLWRFVSLPDSEGWYVHTPILMLIL